MSAVLGPREADADRRLAEAASQALGTMRGLALKIGQMASYVDGIVPEHQRDAYEQAMRKLRDAAPTMPPEAAARVIEQELGSPPSELFAEFEPEPFASASIGQVHRATLRGERRVAVKVQYEGIVRAVEADLSNASLFSALLGPIGAKFKVKDQMAEVRDRFTEELDYRHEAKRQKEFAAIFPSHDKIRIPAVVDELSAKGVLTSELASGLGFDAACAASVAERTAWAETLWTFVFQSLLVHGLFNADPHPGNYLFGDDGRVTFLDFGCTRRMRAEKVRLVRRVHRAASIDHDDDALVDLAMEMLGLSRSAKRHMELGRAYILLCFEPLRAEGPYRMTRDYTRRLYEDLSAMAREMLVGKRDQFSPLAGEWLFFNRLQLGFYSVLARLDAPVDFAAIEHRLLAGPLPEP